MTLELGGKSPNIILPDADLEAAVEGSFQAIYFNTGQACNAGSRLFVHRDQFDEVVVGAGRARAQGDGSGPGLDPDDPARPARLGRAAGARDRLHRARASAEGAELVTGGERPASGDGYFVEPTLFTATGDDLAIAREEIFGPVLVALPYDSLEEVARARQRHRVRPGGGRVDARPRPTPTGSPRCCEPASVYVNIWGAGDPAAPFGGFKASGVGREHGHDGLERLPRDQDRLGLADVATWTDFEDGAADLSLFLALA